MADQNLQDAEKVLGQIPEYSWLVQSGQQWWTVAEVSEHLNVGRDVIRRWAEQGSIAGAVLYGVQLGWRLPRSGLILHLARLVRGGSAKDSAG